MFRFIRRHAVVFRLLSDVAKDNPEAFASSLMSGDITSIDTAVTKAAEERYSTFRTKLTRVVLRTAFFLLLTKSILAFVVELPYEVFILQTTDYLPLTINILFPPLLLTLIGLSVRIPKAKNTARILEELHAILGVGDDFSLIFKRKRPWGRGALWWIFNGFYLFIYKITLIFIEHIFT